MKEEAFNELLESITEAAKISRGELAPSRVFCVEPMDVKAIREKTHKSQESFAGMLGVSAGTICNWEQGCRHPDGRFWRCCAWYLPTRVLTERTLRPASGAR